MRCRAVSHEVDTVCLFTSRWLAEAGWRAKLRMERIMLGSTKCARHLTKTAACMHYVPRSQHSCRMRCPGTLQRRTQQGSVLQSLSALSAVVEASSCGFVISVRERQWTKSCPSRGGVVSPLALPQGRDPGQPRLGKRREERHHGGDAAPAPAVDGLELQLRGA